MRPSLDNAWRRKTLTVMVVVLALLGAGLLLSPLQRPAWNAYTEGFPEIRPDDVRENLGQGLVLALFGGFRAILADLTYIRAYSRWEKRDLAQTEPLIRLSVTLDPRSVFFWTNGQRIIALDLPEWIIGKAGGHDAVPEAFARKVIEDHANRAIDFINQGLRYHPQSLTLMTDKGLLYINRLKNHDLAAATYLRAYELSGYRAHFTARIHANQLREAGRLREAYDFLREHYAQLDDNDPFAAKDSVAQRIAEIETLLNLPYYQRFHSHQRRPDLPPLYLLPTP